MNQQLALEVLTIYSEEQETYASSLLLLLTVSLVVVVIVALFWPASVVFMTLCIQLAKTVLRVRAGIAKTRD